MKGYSLKQDVDFTFPSNTIKLAPKILIADDDVVVRKTISQILEMFDYRVVLAKSGLEALDVIDSSFDAIILDINMPGLDGFQTLEQLNKLDLQIPALFLTGAGSMDYAVRAINLGVYDFLTKPIRDLNFFKLQMERAVQKRKANVREKIYKYSLEEDVRKKTVQLEDQNKLLLSYSKNIENATVQLMTSLQNAMEEKDGYTAGHTMRVTEYAIMLGASMGLTESELIVLRRAAQFHDVGKLVVDVSCIQKPGKLTEEEWARIRKHPEVGANIIKPLGFVDKEIFCVRHHHERVDGKGYPDGLTGDQLDDLTKILTVVDSYDAMTSKRNYRVNMSREDAILELERCSGSQFDPEIVKYFARSIVGFQPSEKFGVDKSLESYLDYIG